MAGSINYPFEFPCISFRRHLMIKRYSLLYLVVKNLAYHSKVALDPMLWRPGANPIKLFTPYDKSETGTKV
jgi:hypothetical protein